MEDQQKFWSSVQMGPLEDCWPWLKGKSPEGYGWYFHNSVSKLAHRYAWELHNEQTIPVGMIIMHSCDNPICCNPAHLILGTKADNNLDRAYKGRGGNLAGEYNGRHVVTEITVLQIYRRSKMLNNVSRIAREFNLARSTVQAILEGRSWNYLFIKWKAGDYND